nr:retrovirus-related Pol polyprotein from transposon TNT 1-94 [Tanacetum cinerariifolium]
MATVNDVPQLVDKKGGSYAAIAPKLELRKCNKLKKRMLCYLAGMEPYYLKCIKDGPFQPKTAKGDAKPESKWTPDDRRVVVQDQRLKSIIMSCLPDDIIETDEEEVFKDEEVTQVKVLIALADDELTVGKSHTRNGEWVNITLKKNNSKRRKMINEKWLTSLKKVSQCISEQIPHQKKKVLGGELLTESLSKININENAFIPASMGYDQEMVPKTKDWVEKFNPDSILPNFNTGRIIVPESQDVNESLETLNTLESSKDSEAEFLTPLPPLKKLQGASPSLEIMPLTFQPHSLKKRPGLCIMKHTKLETHDSSNKSVSGTVTVSETKQTKPSVPTKFKDTKKESKLNELTKLVQMLIDEKVNLN